MRTRSLIALWLSLVIFWLAPSSAPAWGGRRARVEAPQVVEVPRTPEATQQAGRAAAPELVAKYEALPRTASPELLPILEQLRALAPGSADPSAEALLKEFMSLSTASGGAEAAELRGLYDDVFTPLMAGWQAALLEQGEPLQERAELACMHRTALRELTRDLMRDSNAVEILRARDTVKYGQPTGPTFEQLLAKELGKPGATEESAWNAIIGSSQRHNKAVSDEAKKGQKTP